MRDVRVITKRIIALVLVLSLSLNGIISASATTEFKSGDYTYTVSKGEATIVSYPETATGEVEIPAALNGYTVTSIGSYSFYACTLVTEIIIPNTVTSIGNYAFAYCTSLESVTIPRSVTSIGNNAFNGSNKVVIVCGKGSYAEEYAQKNGIPMKQSEGVALDNVGLYYDGFEYTDDFFKTSSYIYNHKMALTSLCFELACFSNEGSYKNPQNIKEMLDAYGFDQAQEFYGYTTKPQLDSIACVLASKNTTVNGKNETIIFVGVRGGGYEAEWGGNFRVGNSVNHDGFNKAAETVLARINTFISTYSKIFKSDSVKFWVTGYSRGAATANLVAAALDDGGFNGYYHYLNIESLDFGASDVYAYTFETPLNTRNENAKNSRYNNIFNIVNRVDFVTKVAPEAWGFMRYGMDCYLPSKETHDGYADKYMDAVKAAYKEVSGAEYVENFCFKKIKVSYDWNWNPVGMLVPVYGLVSSIKIGIEENQSYGMGRYLDELFDIVANTIVGSVKTYVSEYQDTFVKLMPVLMGVDTNGVDLDDTGFWEDLYKALIASIGDALINYDISIIKSTIATCVVSYFSELPLDYDEVYETLGMLDSLLLGLLANLNHTITLFANTKEIKEKHEPRLCLAWMITLAGKFSYDSEVIGSSWQKFFGTAKTYRVMKLNCPIDVYVYDGNGQKKAAIVDDEAQYIEDGLTSYLDENGTKVVCLPNDEEYRVEIVGNDSGSVNFSVAEYDFEKNKETIVQNYYDLDVEKDSEYTVFVEELEESDTKSTVKAVDESGKIIAVSEVIDVSKAEKYTVTVTSNNPDCTVTGGGSFIKGEFAKVSIVPSAKGSFEGWYSAGKRVSVEPEYRFMVTEDSLLEARYVVLDIPDNLEELKIKTPSVNQVKYGDTLILHADFGDEELPEGYAVEWSFIGVGAKLTPYEKGLTCGVTCVDSGEVVVTATLVDADGEPVCDSDGEEIEAQQKLTMKGGFFWKIISFFKDLFRISRVILMGE